MSLKILYIAGFGRSGSTLLNNILGQVQGVFAAGEIYYFWQRLMREGRLCGCGLVGSDCAVWSTVIDRVSHIEPARMVDLARRSTRVRHTPLLLTTSGRRVLEPYLQPYLDGLGRLYSAIMDVTGSKVLVDSSKFPPYGFAVSLLPEVDLRVVHLVRDSRAVAYSWRRKKRQPDTDTRDYMMERGIWTVGTRWMAGNLATEACWGKGFERIVRIRYEDFIAHPRGTTTSILELLGMSDVDLGFLESDSTVLRPTHTVSGNPSRFHTGRVDLVLDNAWRRGLEPLEHAIVGGLTWPLLLRYGYVGGVKDGDNDTRRTSTS